MLGHVVHEWATLGPQGSSADALLSEPAWRWLVDRVQADAEFSKAFSAELRGGQQLLQVEDRVGVIVAPDGTMVEVLPKLLRAGASADSLRRLVLRMLTVVEQLPAIETNEATLGTMPRQLPEVLVRRFLLEVRQLLRGGLRRTYETVSEESRVLRGRLLVAQHVRRVPPKRVAFDVEYEIFGFNRPENRLLRTAIGVVRNATRDLVNHALASEFETLLAEVPGSVDVQEDLRLWDESRNLRSYSRVRPWVRFVLEKLCPAWGKGRHRGIALLYPMERLFEAFVARRLVRQLARGGELEAQENVGFLMTHVGVPIQSLRPDLVVRREGVRRMVLDTKWKVQAGELRRPGNSDAFQMLGYGTRVFSDGGVVGLIYPACDGFGSPIGPFNLAHALQLWLLPFELELERLLVPTTQIFAELFSASGKVTDGARLLVARVDR
ncbi:MAG: hypothetical protein Q8K82_14305 [Gemmatimonadaceae bacterium]|nr:hypothetical protein [Gemmatimonadaceae bacterium]